MENRMRSFKPALLMLSLCLAPPGTVHAAPEKPPAAGQTQQESSAREGASQEGRKSSARSRKPAKTFKPSERIRADSAVSFPVDI